MSESKAGFKAKLIAETKLMAVIFVYLAFLLGSFTVYRRLVLSEYEIGYFHYGYSILEALVLSKVIIIARMLKLGDRFKGWPLMATTIYRTFVFSLFILAFAILEHICEGWIHHESARESFEKILQEGWHEILARVVVMFAALVPLIAVLGIGDALGEGKLMEMFFRCGAGGKIGES